MNLLEYRYKDCIKLGFLKAIFRGRFAIDYFTGVKQVQKIERDSFERFKNLRFEDFKTMAGDKSLSCYEKIGFPDHYRKGFEEKIFEDILKKLPILSLRNKVILDIGPGVSELSKFMIDLCRNVGHTLLLADSAEVLNELPDDPFIIKFPGSYPDQGSSLFKDYLADVDGILCYSVFHYIFSEGHIFDFLDKSLNLLKSHGQMLIGDIPNISKRKRFFSSSAGIKFHQEFMGNNESPLIDFNCVEAGQIDDAVIFSILSRSRSSGFDAYVVPQPRELPMSNRREDILIIKN